MINNVVDLTYHNPETSQPYPLRILGTTIRTSIWAKR
jgi:hypothetical protein